MAKPIAVRDLRAWKAILWVCAVVLVVEIYRLSQGEATALTGAALVAAVLMWGLARLTSRAQAQILLIIVGVLFGLLAMVSVV